MIMNMKIMHLYELVLNQMPFCMKTCTLKTSSQSYEHFQKEFPYNSYIITFEVSTLDEKLIILSLSL